MRSFIADVAKRGVMSRPKAERIEKLFVRDYPEKEVHPIDCVPEYRPHNSWTMGVKAWDKGENSGEMAWVGWFHPPRRRQSPARYTRNKRKGSFGLQSAPPLNEEKKRAKVRKHYIRVLRSKGYSMREAKAIMAGTMDLERNPIVPEFSESDEISAQEEE